MDQRYGPRRSRATRKPSVHCPQTAFFRCGRCGRLVQRLDWGEEAGGGLACCGAPMEALSPIQLQDLPQGVALDYRITGGYNDNVVELEWASEDPACRLEWAYLRTFTGGILKYPPPGKRPPLIFPLADEDAYAYCDQSPCLECVFRCKRGFILYVCLSGVGLVELPIDRMNPYWETKSQHPEGSGMK